MIIEAFAESHLTHNLSPKQIESLFAAGIIQRYAAETLVINEGEELKNLYVILAGQVSVFLPAREERLADVQLSVLEKNNCIGEYSFIDHQPASASVPMAGSRITTRIRLPIRLMLRVVVTVSGDNPVSPCGI